MFGMNNREKKTLSVVIPAYNAEKFIRSTVESALAQTYPVTEIIVVDDGSEDETLEILQSFGDKITILGQDHEGVSAARNLGITRAQGEYIAFLDADDLWLPQKIELQMEALADGVCQWVYCDPAWIDGSNGKKITRRYPKRHEGFVLEKLFQDCFIASATPVIHKSVFDEVGLFNEQTRFGEDREMWMRIAAVYPIKHVPEVLALIRLHPSSATYTIPVELKLKDQISTMERVLKIAPERLQPFVKYRMSELYYRFSKECVVHNDLKKARVYIKESLEFNPHSFHALFLFLFLKLNPTLINLVMKVYRHSSHSIRRR